MPKLNALVAGSTGYIGTQLIKILVKHKYINIKYLCGNSSVGKSISSYEKSLSKYKLPNKAGIPYENHKVVFWKKVLLPFSCCIIVFIGLPFLFTRMRSTNQSQRLIFGVLFGIAYFVLTSIITNLSLIIGIPALPSVLISMILFIAIGIYLFNSLVKKDIPI